MSKSLEVLAPAKLNIRLKVTGLRADGYHELESIMVPVGFYDRLRLTAIRDSDILLECRGLPLPAAGDNLVYRAAEAFFLRVRGTAGVSIQLTKAIPVAAGLGGGSSDAATTLMALNRLWGDRLSLQALDDLAVGLGADVPFFLRKCSCLARGIGEILEPLETWPEFWYVVITPSIAVSTAWAYENLKLELTTLENNSINTILGKSPIKVTEILENDLETVTVPRFPVIDTIKNALLDAGAMGALMTGSGPSVFGIFNSKTHAMRAAAELAPGGFGNMFVAQGIP